jgi:putative tryptophan/tyrosine transport system substrate-binding protein
VAAGGACAAGRAGAAHRRDPIGAGLIASLARPGGNFTGLQNYEASITGKWLAMLKEIEPRLTRAGLVGDSQSTDFGYFLRASEAVAPSLVIDIVPLGVENAADIERAIDSRATGRQRDRTVEPVE